MSAEVRLERFIQRHSEIQAGQLETHAVTDAHEMLAEIYVEQGKPRKAARLLEQMARRTPLNYRLWLLLAEAARSAASVRAPRIVKDILRSPRKGGAGSRCRLSGTRSPRQPAPVTLNRS